MISFWHLIPESEVKNAIFCSTLFLLFSLHIAYTCLRSFSAMKLIKNKNCSRLTDLNLNGQNDSTTNLQPDIEKLASNIQSQNSISPYIECMLKLNKKVK